MTFGVTAVAVLALMAAAGAAEHPRVLVSKADVDKIRARAKEEPYASMVKAMQAQVARPAAPDPTKSVLYDDRAVDFAALYVLTGDRKHAAEAEKIVLAMVRDQTFWNNPGSKGLTRAAGAMRASLAFDLCHEAWPESTRTLVSQKLRFAADGMMKSMGAGANTGLANNWQAVRYGGAGIAFLASDEPGGDEGAKKAFADLKRHLGANLGDNGWNPEGIGYTQYPWQFTGPFGIAAQRAGIGDLRKDVKKAALTFWTTYVGTVAIPQRPGASGLRADLSDDHPCWSADGTVGMAFWYAPQETLGGLKWMYDYLCGAKGDGSWGANSAGGLYSILYYPADLPARNPAEVAGLGLNYTDKSHGIALFRNAFKDENDIVAVVNGHARQPQGCHGGSDTNTFRIMGLGSCWAVGSGRTGDPSGQTNLFPGAPTKLGKGEGGGLGKLEAFEFAPNGGGWALTSGSCVGVKDQKRVFGADYSTKSGAAAVFVVAETSSNGAVWRLNTPEFNEIAQTNKGFVLKGPPGSTLVASVIQPAAPKFRGGIFERGGGAGHAGFPYRGTKYINNKWIEFDCDKNVLVVMTLQGKGQDAPTVTGTGAAAGARIRVGSQDVTIESGKVVFK